MADKYFNLDGKSFKLAKTTFYELRLRQHLTLYKIYRQSGMCPSAIDNIEIGRGNLPLAWYLKLADFYGKKIKIEIAD